MNQLKELGLHIYKLTKLLYESTFRAMLVVAAGLLIITSYLSILFIVPAGLWFILNHMWVALYFTLLLYPTSVVCFSYCWVFIARIYKDIPAYIMTPWFG